MKAAVFYGTYGHWTQSLLNARIPLAYHYQPRLDIDPNNEQVGWIGDPLAKQILFRNFPNVQFRPPSVDDEAYDLMIGSPPCIGISVGNKTMPGRREEHPANRHMVNFFKWVTLISPKYFLMEMVPTLKNCPKLFEECLSYVRDYYRLDWGIFNALDYGACQDRKRFMIWGRRKDLPSLDSPLCTLKKREFTPIGEVLSKELIQIYDEFKPDGKTCLSMIGKNGKPIAGAWGWLKPDRREKRRLNPEKWMFTITSTSVRDCIHYSKDRLLTIPELKILMGFPISYYIPPTNAGTASKIIASGVDVRFASYLLEHIKMVLEA